MFTESLPSNGAMRHNIKNKVTVEKSSLQRRFLIAVSRISRRFSVLRLYLYIYLLACICFIVLIFVQNLFFLYNWFKSYY
jgi:hypothetical protein